MHLFSFNHRSRSLRPSALARVAALALVCGIGNPLLNAQVFNEAGDAGQTIGTAQATGLSQPLGPGPVATINGTLASPTDIDIFQFNVINPFNLEISTVNPITGSAVAPHGPGGLDTQLFLFDSAGRAVVMNDDAPGLNVLQSLIPGHNAFTAALAAGVYYIAIALAGVDPANINNQLLFAMNGGNTQAVRGPAAGTSPNTLDHWTGAAFSPEFGAYQINITNVPDTGSTLLLIGLAFMGLALLHRRVAAPATSRS